MKQFVKLIVLEIFIVNFSFSQVAPVWVTNKPTMPHYGITTGFQYAATLNAGIGFATKKVILNRNVVFEAELSSPIFLLKTKSKNIFVGGSSFLLGQNFDIKLSVGLETKKYENILADGMAFQYKLGIMPGIFRRRFYIGSAFYLKNNILTTFSSNDHTGSVMLFNTSNYMGLGLNTGFLLGNKVGIIANVNYNMPANRTLYGPFTQPIGAGLAVTYQIKK